MRPLRQAALRAGVAAALAVGAVLGARAAGAQSCEPWPHEPAPLPTVDAADPLAAHWARLRADELATAARAFEQAGERNPAHRIWRHVACLSPARPGLAAALARTAPVRIHRPEVVRVAVRAAAPTVADLETALALLRGPIPVELPPPPTPAPAPRPSPGEAVAAVEEMVRGARFEEALEAASQLRAALGEDAAPAVRARLEVAAATAALALGRDDEADASFRRALAADPKLSLDPQRTSPKVLRALERVRGAAGRGGSGA